MCLYFLFVSFSPSLSLSRCVHYVSVFCLLVSLSLSLDVSVFCLLVSLSLSLSRCVCSKGPKTRTLPLTAKSSNPYVVNPNRTHPQGQTTPLATPTDDKTGTRCAQITIVFTCYDSMPTLRTVVGVNGEPLKSPGDETPSYTTVLPSLPQ